MSGRRQEQLPILLILGDDFHGDASYPCLCEATNKDIYKKAKFVPIWYNIVIYYLYFVYYQ